ncbi:CDP-diacylglycerol-glycerol-3-phosphate 3-phosphatidyltransferase [Pseudohyphozyma bogoriensis]|nr:CDP-diacylglycerol-glycerol-3-phosphate 3-phosphatidyltransferase [Pseudohyphozyma bogoriensis]
MSKAATKAKTKPELSVSDKIKRQYLTLHAQLEASFLDNALKTCDRILRLDPEDTLAQQTKIQLLIALERYVPALSLLGAEKKASLEGVYCLYKTGRIAEASDVIEEVGASGDAEEDRGLRVLEAQVKFRQEDFQASQDLYDELIHTTDADSPELPDLENNLQATQSHLDFIASVPSHLSTASTSALRLPSLEKLESTPVAPLIHSYALYKPPVPISKAKGKEVAQEKAAEAATKATKGKKGKSKASGDKPLDPDRWLPKKQRPEFQAEILRKKEMERGKKKQARAKLEAGLTQGSAEPAAAPSTPQAKSVPSPSSWRTVQSSAPLALAGAPPSSRTIQIERRHPAFNDLAGHLTSLPSFWTRGRDVKILYEPKEFYQTLLAKIKAAKHRIFIASLYVGKAESELIDALHSALAANPSLRVTIVLDYLRCTRETPNPSSASLVGALAAAFPDQVELRLYHTTQLTGWRKKVIPRRLDEGWGLQHMKCYGFDDTVIMSGANLSNDYFTNRQDRYVEFIDNPPLADYFASLLANVASYSFLVTASDTTTKHPAIDITWPSSNPISSPLAPSTSIDDFKLHAGSTFNSLTSFWAAKKPEQLRSTLPWSPHEPKTFDTILRPVLQMGPFGIRQETDLVVPTIFKTGNSLATAPGGRNTRIDWTSGYFSVQPDYLEGVMASRAIVRIVTASPEANGFLNSKGISKYIPPAYTYLTKEFYDESRRRAASHGKDSHVDLKEWRRDGWTYHAKGIWLTPALSNVVKSPLDSSPLHDPNERDEEIKANHPEAPYLTLIGSSNYGQRSATRDLEANVLVTTSSSELRADLQEEILQLRHFAIDKVDDKLFERKDRHVPYGVKLAARVIESML